MKPPSDSKDDNLTGIFYTDAEPQGSSSSTRGESIARRLKELFARENKLPEIYGDDDGGLVQRLREITVKYDLTGDDVRVFYPGSATHAGAARAFGKHKVHHLDPDEAAMKALRESGYKAETGTMEDFHPGHKFDLIFSLNAGTLEPELLQRLLKPGGLVVANNYHSSANQMAEYPDFELLEGFLPRYEDGRWVGAEEAAASLGTKYFKVVDRSAEVVSSESGDPEALAVPLSADALYVFRHKPTNKITV